MAKSQYPHLLEHTLQAASSFSARKDIIELLALSKSKVPETTSKNMIYKAAADGYLESYARGKYQLTLEGQVHLDAWKKQQMAKYPDPKLPSPPPTRNPKVHDAMHSLGDLAEYNATLEQTLRNIRRQIEDVLGE